MWLQNRWKRSHKIRMNELTRWSSSTQSFHSNTAVWIHLNSWKRCICDQDRRFNTVQLVIEVTVWCTFMLKQYILKCDTRLLTWQLLNSKVCIVTEPYIYYTHTCVHGLNHTYTIHIHVNMDWTIHILYTYMCPWTEPYIYYTHTSVHGLNHTYTIHIHVYMD